MITLFKLSIARVGVAAMEILLAPLTLAGAAWLRFIRWRVREMRITRRILSSVGVFPLCNDYYDPLIDFSRLRRSLRDDRKLPGLDLNAGLQLEFLDRFEFNDELLQFPLDGPSRGMSFYYHNGLFGSGDAEYLYSMIRLLKPRRLVEIGSGFSTLLAGEANRKNSALDPACSCEHVCIEPYPSHWREMPGVTLVPCPVETADKALFARLEEGDILFIDTSHIIRPQGDVLYLYQEVLPALSGGVYVQIHDVFTPKDYPAEWLVERSLMWNEQYLLEAFLSFNARFEVVGACNFLAHHHRERFAAKCPVFAKEADEREPGSFWIRVRR